jgi:phospholipase C
VPFIAVSPFSKRHYASHTVGDHTSILRLIELRFLAGKNSNLRDHLTARDQGANRLFDLFDFVHKPSANVDLTQIPSAPVPNVVTDGNGSCVQAP